MEQSPLMDSIINEQIDTSVKKKIFPILTPIKFLFFVALIPVLAACPSQNQRNWQQEIIANKFNLPDPISYDTLGIKFQLSAIFQPQVTWTTHWHTLKEDSAVTFRSRDINIEANFGIAKYTAQEVEILKKNAPKTTAQTIDILQAYVVQQRYNELEEKKHSTISEPIQLQERINKKGVMQCIEQIPRDIELYYIQNKEYYLQQFLIATIVIESDFYVFQWMTNPALNAHFFDDFLAILQSVER